MIIVVVAKSCPTLCDPVNCSVPGSSVHGFSQARILEWKKKKESWSRLPFPTPEDLPGPGIKPLSPALAACVHH